VGSGAMLSGVGTVDVGPAMMIGSGSGVIKASGGTLDLKGNVTGGSSLVIDTTPGSDLKIDGIATATSIAISNANQTLESGAAASLTLSNSETITAGKIQLDGGTLTDSVQIFLDSGTTLNGKGIVAAAMFGSGTLTASGGGTLDLTGTVNQGLALTID